MIFVPHAARLASAAALIAAAGLAVTASTAQAGPARAASRPIYAIGFEGPMSGPSAKYGITENNAVRLAIAQANASGRYPFRLRLRTVNDHGDPVKSPAAAVQMVSDTSVLGVVGPTYSASTQAVGHTYEQARLGFVTPSATNPTLSHNHWSVFHRIMPSDTAEARQVGDWLVRRGVHRLYVLHDTSEYGREVGHAVTVTVRAHHRHVIEAHTPATPGTNWHSLAAAVVRSGAHAVYYGGYDAQAAMLAKALKRAGFHHLRASSNGVFSPTFTMNAGAAGNGWYVSCGCTTAYRTAAGHAFARAYRARFGHSPGDYSGAAYDAANAVIRAIGQAVAHGHHSRRAVNAALGRLDFAGVTTRVRFAADGDIASSAARVTLYRDRARHFVQIGDIRAAQ